jgi:general secretion pathway protein H
MRAAGDNHPNAGFTLVEILVVLAITAVVFGLSVLSISALRRGASPDVSAQEIVGLLNGVRERAMRRMVAQSAMIDLEEKTIDGNFDEGFVLPPTHKLVVTVGRETVSDVKRIEIHFLPDGTSSGAVIEISDPNGKSARVETNWLTGLSRRVDAGD